MANDLDTQYLAVRAAIITAVQTAWGNVEVLTEDFVVEETPSNVPRAYVQFDAFGGANETASTDTKTIQFMIAGIFAADTTNGNDYLRITKAKALEAELYAATNLGGYSYLNQVVEINSIRYEDSLTYAGVQIKFQCQVSHSRI